MINTSEYKNIIIFTGAGVSAPSGIPTFRGENGFWNDVDVDKYVSRHSFTRYPKRSWELFDKLTEMIKNSEYNSIHSFLAGIKGTIVTLEYRRLPSGWRSRKSH